MRLFANYVAGVIASSLDGENGEVSRDLVSELSNERSRIFGSAIKVMIFLFTTITVISIVILGGTEKPAFFGIIISDPKLFAFTAFLVGNFAYAACTCLFAKIIIYEYLIVYLLDDKNYSGQRVLDAFVRSFHANLISFYNIYGVADSFSRRRSLFFNFVNFYTKYGILIFYGFFYYANLGYYLIQILEYDHTKDYVYSITLIIFNIITIITSYFIFYIEFKPYQPLAENNIDKN